MRTKICGIRNESDLAIALEAGADAIGLICGINHRSEDEVTPEVARRLTEAAPPFVSTVLVTHHHADHAERTCPRHCCSQTTAGNSAHRGAHDGHAKPQTRCPVTHVRYLRRSAATGPTADPPHLAASHIR